MLFLFLWWNFFVISMLYRGFRMVLVLQENRILLHLFFHPMKMEYGIDIFLLDNVILLLVCKWVLQLISSMLILILPVHSYHQLFWIEQKFVLRYLQKLTPLSGVLRCSLLSIAWVSHGGNKTTKVFIEFHFLCRDFSSWMESRIFQHSY